MMEFRIVDFSSIANFKTIVDKYFSSREYKEFQQVPKHHIKDWLSGRLALKKAYGNFKKNIEYRGIVILKNKDGIPFIKNEKQLHCSIAHSAGIGLGVVSNKRIGCDIEKIRSHRNDIINYICTKEELSKCSTKNEPSDLVITSIWVVKEAVLKAIGKGFRYNPKIVKIYSRFKNTYKIILKNRGGYGKKWDVVTHRDKNYVIAIATTKNETHKPTIHRHKYSELQSPAIEVFIK